MPQSTRQLIEMYYQRFNAGDMEGFLSLLDEQVRHDINEGPTEVGRALFRQFMARMNRNYREQLVDLVILVSEDGRRAAAEFVVLGEYLNTDDGLPEARGQTYRLPAGAFFEVRDGRVARISNYYNLSDWLAQVGG